MRERVLGRLASSRGWIAALLTTAALAAAPAAEATPPQMVGIDNDAGFVRIGWTLPAGEHSWMIEIASSPPNPDGTFSAGTIAFFDDVTDPSATIYESPARLAVGTYFVHVVGYGNCVPSAPGCPEYSEAVQFTVPLPSPPTLDSAVVASDRRVTATWSGLGFLNDLYIEFATSPEVQADGPDAGAFLDRNTFLVDGAIGATQTRWDSLLPFPGGTYYVHVAAFDPLACQDENAPSCVLRFSNIKSFAVPSGAPRLDSVGRVGHQLTASWSLPAGPVDDFIEVATRPEVRDDGAFRDENVVLFDASLGAHDRIYRSDFELPAGTYYVHVASLPSTSCYFGEHPECVDEYSAILPVTVPEDPTAPLPAALTSGPAPDTATAFSSISVPKRQHLGDLSVRAAMGEKGTITASGTVKVPRLPKLYKLAGATAPASPGKAVKLRLKLSKKALRAVKRALRAGRAVVVTIKIKATDGAGNVAVQTRKVKLRR